MSVAIRHWLQSPVVTEQKCCGCKLIKPLEAFHKHVGRKNGRTEYCKECRNDRIVSQRHNLEEGALKHMFEIQGDKCAICNVHKETQKKSLAVDHCHKSGKIRGLLCSNCNNGIGRFKDDPELLENAIKYLEKK